jgi:ATP-binding protein involved in chromosome partitioning
MPLTETHILEALRGVRDPDSGQDIVALHQVKGVKIFEGSVSVELATPSPRKEELRATIAAALGKIAGVEEVFVNFAAAPAAPKPGHAERPPHAHQPPGVPTPRGLPGVAHIVAVGAGKGGVGKSTVAVNLALGLALMGKKVAILDGDIYGPSIPTLTGIEPQAPRIEGERIIPFAITAQEHPGVSVAVMSIGFMVDKEKALIWRGPMAHGAMKQMLEQVDWTHTDAGTQDATLD